VSEGRTVTEPEQQHHYVTHEPKFCRCRVCHEHFYGETIEQARTACLEHARWSTRPGATARATAQTEVVAPC
jgi:hypothetical protein